MTCIIGLINGSEVFMGGDRCESHGYCKNILPHSKLIQLKRNFMIGISGTARIAGLLRFGFECPKQKKGQNDYEYLSTDFAEAVRNRLKKGGIAEVKDNKEAVESYMAIAFNRALYTMDAVFYVSKVSEGFTAVGCGEKYALGSLNSTTNESDARKRIRTALESAERFSMGVQRPFDIKKLSNNGNEKSKMERPVKKGK